MRGLTHPFDFDFIGVVCVDNLGSIDTHAMEHERRRASFMTPTTTTSNPPNTQQVLRPKPALLSEMTRFHSDDYVNFLRVITPDNMQEYMRQLQR